MNYHFLAIAPEQELNCVQDVTLAAAVESGDGVELRVEPVDLCAVLIGFESVEDNLPYIHCFEFILIPPIHQHI